MYTYSSLVMHAYILSICVTKQTLCHVSTKRISVVSISLNITILLKRDHNGHCSDIVWDEAQARAAHGCPRPSRFHTQHDYWSRSSTLNSEEEGEGRSTIIIIIIIIASVHISFVPLSGRRSSARCECSQRRIWGWLWAGWTDKRARSSCPCFGRLPPYRGCQQNGHG